MVVALTALRVLSIVFGIYINFIALNSTIQTLVLPRAAPDPLTRVMFTGLRKIFELRMKIAETQNYKMRDRMMAFYGPVAMLMLPFMYLTCVLLGFAFIFWGLGVGTPWESFVMSGSSLLTLGTVQFGNVAVTSLMFLEAMIGLVLVALLIAYLPTMYSAFSVREQSVNRLEIPAGSPPSPATMLIRLHRIGRLEASLNDLWMEWEDWFTSLDESHTSLAPLVFFRSPKPDHSWVTAAGVVLDTAALANAAVDLPHNARADLCIRAGYVALRDIADFFQLEYDPKPDASDPISISQQEFDDLLEELETEGILIKDDREQAWKDFAGWRVNYDSVLLQIAELTMAPYAQWVSDRGVPKHVTKTSPDPQEAESSSSNGRPR